MALDEGVDGDERHFESAIGADAKFPELADAKSLIDGLALRDADAGRLGGLRVRGEFPEALPEPPFVSAGFALGPIGDGHRAGLVERVAVDGALMFAEDPSEQKQAPAAKGVAAFHEVVHEANDERIDEADRARNREPTRVGAEPGIGRSGREEVNDGLGGRRAGSDTLVDDEEVRDAAGVFQTFDDTLEGLAFLFQFVDPRLARVIADGPPGGSDEDPTGQDRKQGSRRPTDHGTHRALIPRGRRRGGMGSRGGLCCGPRDSARSARRRLVARGVAMSGWFGAEMRQVGGAYVSARAVVCGDVTLGRDVSVWPYVVIRGDVAPIWIGDRTNIQDGSVLHCRTGVPLVVGSDVVVGHQAVVHCARVGDGCLVGIRSVVLDNAEIGDGALIAAGAVVPPGMRVPAGMIVMGSPAKVLRPVRAEDRTYHQMAIENYLRLAREHTAGQWPGIRGSEQDRGM